MKRQFERVAVRRRRLQRIANKLNALIAGLEKERDLVLRLKAQPGIKEAKR